MQGNRDDLNRALMLDGNAAAGRLQAMFGVEMTTTAAECANCGSMSEMGALLAFTHSPGLVLRCPTCEGVMLRIVETPNATYLDARGMVYLKFSVGRTGVS